MTLHDRLFGALTDLEGAASLYHAAFFDPDPMWSSTVWETVAYDPGANTPLSIQIRAREKSDLTAHHSLTKTQATRGLEEKMRAVAACLDPIALCARCTIRVEYKGHGPQAKLALFLDDLMLEDTYWGLDTVLETLVPRLAQLALLPALGPFHTFAINGRLVRAPDAASAVFKHGLLGDGHFDPAAPTAGIDDIRQVIPHPDIQADLARHTARLTPQDRP